MKQIKWGLSLLALSGTLAHGEISTNVPSVRVGIYDSRAVAYAFFSSASQQQELSTWVSEAKLAKNSGDAEKFNRLSAKLRDHQADMHRQVFSVAPATESMAAIEAKFPAVKVELGVTALVSKWDEKSLKRYQDAEQIDVTDQLVQKLIQPDAKQTKVLESFKTTKPISLEQCDELIRTGKI